LKLRAWFSTFRPWIEEIEKQKHHYLFTLKQGEEEKMKPKISIVALCLVAVAVMAVVYTAGWHDGQTGQRATLVKEAQAAGGVVKDPKGEAPDRYVYYPGTEPLAEDEIRVIACGTGMPAARRAQAATCFLVETGNGDKFIFDIGSGSMANLAALMIP
jgi:ribonuclease Z